MRALVRRFWIPLILLAVFCMLATAFVVWDSNRPGPTFHNVARVQVGMTPSEVEAILGTPWKTKVTDEGTEECLYCSDESCESALVVFALGRVESTDWFGNIPPTLMERIRDWLGL